jgi:hypothetical protein
VNRELQFHKELNARFAIALRLIAGPQCEHFTSGNCQINGRIKGAIDGADSWCKACIASEALSELKDKRPPA